MALRSPAPELAPIAAVVEEPASDGALAARARDGDVAAFEALHSRFARVVHALLLAHLSPRDRQGVEDLEQEVFLLAWRRLSTLRESERFGPWLAAIARHAALGVARRARESAAPLEEAASRPLEPTSDGAEILRLLVELPEAYRETLALRLVEGLSGPEIAEATGLTHGSVRVNLHRGMQLLRERLRQEGYA
jgi:RNA polymerase sigma-70 factor (ECF subfamily)